MQTMRCVGGDNRNLKTVITGSVDPDTGISQSLKVERYFKEKVELSDFIFARELQPRRTPEGRIQIWSEWMQKFSLTLPVVGSKDAKVDMTLQSGMIELSPDNYKCSFAVTDEDTIVGRELCFAHSGFCEKFGSRFPQANEREKFVKDASEYERTNPILANRRLVECKGQNALTKTNFSLRGTIDIPVENKVSTIESTNGTFIVEAETIDGDNLFRKFPADSLSVSSDWKAKKVRLRSDGKLTFALNRSYDGTKWDAVVEGGEYGLTESFRGQMNCTETRLTPDELASNEHCNNLFLGCVAFRRAHSDKLPEQKDLYELRFLHEKERAARQKSQ